MRTWVRMSGLSRRARPLCELALAPPCSLDASVIAKVGQWLIRSLRTYLSKNQRKICYCLNREVGRDVRSTRPADLFPHRLQIRLAPEISSDIFISAFHIFPGGVPGGASGVRDKPRCKIEDSPSTEKPPIGTLRPSWNMSGYSRMREADQGESHREAEKRKSGKHRRKPVKRMGCPPVMQSRFADMQVAGDDGCYGKIRKPDHHPKNDQAQEIIAQQSRQLV